MRLGDVHGGGSGCLCDLDELTDGLDALLDEGRAAMGKLVGLLLGRALIGHDPVAVDLGLVLVGDHSDVNIRAGAEVIEDTGFDSLGNQVHGLLLVHGRAPVGLEDGHGGQGARAHGDKGQAVDAPVRVDGVQVGPSAVHPAQDQGCSDMPLVPEQVLLQHRHGRSQTDFSPTVKAVELQLGADQVRGELRISSGSGSTAVNIRGNEVDLFTVLISHNGTFRSPSIGTQNNAILFQHSEKWDDRAGINLVDEADDGGAGLGGLGGLHALLGQCLIPNRGDYMDSQSCAVYLR